MASPRIEFDWDPAKAQRNLAKHGVSFNEAMAVFEDPLALTIADEDHRENEERWITLGETKRGRLLLAVHTYLELADGVVTIRIISARFPTKREVKQYQEGI